MRGALCLGGHGQELSGEAKRRLKWMDYYETHGHNARLTAVDDEVDVGGQRPAEEGLGRRYAMDARGYLHALAGPMLTYPRGLRLWLKGGSW